MNLSNTYTQRRGRGGNPFNDNHIIIPANYLSMQDYTEKYQTTPDTVRRWNKQKLINTVKKGQTVYVQDILVDIVGFRDAEYNAKIDSLVEAFTKSGNQNVNLFKKGLRAAARERYSKYTPKGR